MKKSILRVTCFLLLTGMVLGYANKVLAIKNSDGVSQFREFYKLELNTVDVLVLGSSLAYMNINNGTLYEEYGMASYDLCGAEQPIWNSYYYLKEALKTQKPELVVLDAFRLANGDEYSTAFRMICNVDGMRWSTNKLKAIWAGAAPGEKRSALLRYAQYHTRYRQLSKGDFFTVYGETQWKTGYNWFWEDWKGQYLYSMSVPQQMNDVSHVTSKSDMTEKVERYYRQIIELAQAQNIPILVVVAPFPAIGESAQAIYNRAEEIAKEYGVNFLNCNRLINEIGMDPETHYIDPFHMTVEGSIVYSRYLGNYIQENYEISDRRGDPAYASWERNAEYTNRYLENYRLQFSASLNEISRYLQNPDYWVMISADGTCTTSDENIRWFLEEQGIYDEGVNGIWLKENGTLVWGASVGTTEKYLHTDAHDFCLRHVSETNQNTLLIDNIPRNNRVTNGLNIVVYDTKTRMILDTIGINQDDGYSIIR